jgi:hypothetical protein
MNRPNVATMIHVIASVPDEMCDMRHWWCATSGCIAGWTAATFSSNAEQKSWNDYSGKNGFRAFIEVGSEQIARDILGLSPYQADMIFGNFPLPDGYDDDDSKNGGRFYKIWMLGRLQYALDRDGKEEMSDLDGEVLYTNNTPDTNEKGVTEMIIELGTQVYERERAFVREMNIDPECPVQLELCAPEAVCSSDLVCVETELP